MRTWKSIISMVLSILIIGMNAISVTSYSATNGEEPQIAAVAATNDEAEIEIGTSGDCTWKLAGTVLTISGNGETDDYNWSRVPWGTGITDVIISDGVTRVGAKAFRNCYDLENVDISDTVTSIGEDAFLNTRWYNNQSDGLLYVGKTVYNVKGECPDNVTIKEGTKGIADTAFEGCNALESVLIPNSVKRIGNSAFRNCKKLTSVTIPDSVESIGERAFNSCESLASITLPNTVSSIGSFACDGCPNLTIHRTGVVRGCTGDCVWTLDQNDVLTIRGSGAMGNGSPWDGFTVSVKEVRIEKGVTEIGTSAFAGRVPFDGVINLYKNINKIDIPDTVTQIGASAFTHWISLQHISIPKGVREIRESTFYGCYNLENISFPENLKKIGDYSFWCSPSNGYTPVNQSLKSLDIPDSVEEIGAYAFYGYKNLKEVTLKGVTSLGSGSFGCYNDTDPVTGVNMGYFVDGFTIYGFEGSVVEQYIKDSNKYNHNSFVFVSLGSTEKQEYSYITLEDDTIEIRKYHGEKSELTLPSKINGKLVSSIGTSAFYDCQSLTSVIIPEGITNIGNQAFMWCENLATIGIPETVTHVGYSAFNQTTFMNHHSEDSVIYCGCVLCEIKGFETATILNIKDGTKVIADNACVYAEKLDAVYCPDSLVTIGNMSFKGCSDLKSVHFSESLMTIGTGAFEDCYELNINALPNSLTYLGNSAFCYCSSIESLSVPRGITEISEGTFFDCKNMKSIYLPSTICKIAGKSIGYSIDNKYNTIKNNDFTIYGYKGTEAERYATDNGFIFISLDDMPKPGDADGDGEVTLTDATAVQMYLEGMYDADEAQMAAADVDQNGELEIIDATFIQRYAVCIEIPYTIG